MLAICGPSCSITIPGREQPERGAPTSSRAISPRVQNPQLSSFVQPGCTIEVLAVLGEDVKSGLRQAPVNSAGYRTFRFTQRGAAV